MDTKLTEAEIQTCIEAIDLWENDPSAFTASLLGAMLAKDKDEAKANIQREGKQADENRKLRRERGIMLKAKLLMMRDTATAERALAST